MNAKEWAKKLNGREYTKEITAEEEKQAAANGIIIIFGASDDLLEFRGVIDDEFGANGGREVKLTPDLTIFNPTENRETFKYNESQIVRFPMVKAVWCPAEIDVRWLIVTDLPCETFDILEDGELFCRGVVIEAKEVKANV